MELTIKLKPEGYYEAIDDDGYPQIAYTDQETGAVGFVASQIPELSASKKLSGAIMGVFSMIRHSMDIDNLKSLPIKIYRITEEPDIVIDGDGLIDFKYLCEVRYRREVSAEHLSTIILPKKWIETLNDIYTYLTPPENYEDDSVEKVFEKYNLKDMDAMETMIATKLTQLDGMNIGGYYRGTIDKNLL